MEATGRQIGLFDAEHLTLRQHRWVPHPGAAVVQNVKADSSARPPKGWFLLGHVLGTPIPIYLDLAEASGGHLAILGMTKMGKTTLACRIVKSLSTDRPVVIIDKTGEYRTKRGAKPWDAGFSWKDPGLVVREAAKNDVGADIALSFVKDTVDQASVEYEAGEPRHRTILIDEAHQFIPEPATLGFNYPGRDSALELGVHVMQLRKYGLSMILVSQRTAVVAKSALSQCENLLAFKNVDQTGLDYLEQVAGSGVKRMLSNLRQGEAIAVGPAVSAELPVAIRVLDEWVSLAPDEGAGEIVGGGPLPSGEIYG